MLSFLSPLFLAGAAAAAVPIVLHLLKREPEVRVRFAAVRFLREAPVERTDKHRLRELLLLALRVGALVLLAVAFARPFLRAKAVTTAGGTTIVALDTSYSLSAPGRFETARRLAREAVSRAPAGDRVGVVTFADDAQIVARPGEDRVLANAAIDRAAVGFGATRYRSALSASTQALDGKRGTIVVVTDLQENGWDAGDRVSVPEGTTIEVADVGAIPANLAVTAVRPQADRVVATVHNAGAAAREAVLHLTIDDRPAGDARTSLGPNQSADVLFARAPRGSVARVAVDDPDGIQADNVRYAVLDGAAKPSVLVVTGSGDLSRDGFYAQQALSAGAAGPAYDVAAISGAQLSADGADAIGPRAAVLLLSTRGLERRGREALAAYVGAGGGIIVAAGPDLDGDVVADVLSAESTLRVAAPSDGRPEPRMLAPADLRHPVFEAFAGSATSLGLVRFRRAARITGSACQTLARFTTGDAALIECPSGDGRALVVASDLDNRWNDFPLHATFVPFLHEAVGYVASARGHASEYFIADAPPGARKTPGVATLGNAGAGQARKRVAVNVDPRESDLARLSPADFQSAVTRLKDETIAETRVEARQQEDRQHLWQFLVAAMALALAVEGAVAARTA